MANDFKIISLRVSEKTYLELEVLAEKYEETKVQFIRRIIEDRFLKEGFKHADIKALEGSN
jgi:hypothetical protein